MDINETNDLLFFYNSVMSYEHLKDIPLAELECLDIELLQKTSAYSNFDGLMFILGVDFYTKKLVVQTISPDRRSKPLLAFAESPDSTIYISKSADTKNVVKILREISDRYDFLNPPAFQKYNDKDTHDGDIWKVSVEEFLRGNLQAKYKHEIFMRDHHMHQIVIPTGYKFRLVK